MTARDDLDAFHACLKRYKQTADLTQRAEFAKQSVDHYEAAIKQEPQLAIFPCKYIIDSVLGVGTATYVFKVRTDGGYPAALKVLKSHVHDDSIVVAFRQELEKLCSDEFKNVARVYEVFKDPHHVGFTMAYAEGKSLELGRPVKPTNNSSDDDLDRYFLDVARLALQIAEAVCGLHRQSILHLDLRPGNVIRGADGKVTIVDCRCLTLQLAMIPLAGPMALAAVLPFVAPEVLEDAAGQHSDVHSFGKLIVFIMEGRADANAAHDALQTLADRAPKLAVMLRAAIDSAADQRPPNFEQIVAGLQRAVRALQDRIKEREEGPETRVETDFLGLVREFALKYKRGELRGRLEWTFGTLAIGLVTAAYSERLAEKGFLKLLVTDQNLAACMLVILSYIVLGSSFFFNISNRVRFWRQPGRDKLRFFMSFWYALPIVVALWRPALWAFCAASGMTVVSLFNWSMWSYLHMKHRVNPKYFTERRVNHEFMVFFVYFINSTFGSTALWAIGIILMWIRTHTNHTEADGSLFWIQLLLALLVTLVNLLVWWTAVRPKAIRGLGLIAGTDLEYEIRDWTFTHAQHANVAHPTHPVIEEIRRRRAGVAPSAGVKLGLVVEGGGMRGIISGGALVALEKLGLSGVFDEVYGESAGAINACYFLAGQAEFGSHIYADYLTSRRFVNPLRVGTILDIGYAIYEVVGGSVRLDCDAVLRSPSRLFVALTEVERGVPRLVDVKSEGIPLLKLLEGTGAITPLYNKPAEIQGAHYVDGGITNPIPVKSAILQGCTHILVLLTRPSDFLMRPYNIFERALLWPFFRKWPPAFIRTFYEVRYPNYNDARALALGCETLRDGIQIAAVLPSVNAGTITRITTSRKRLTGALAESVEQTLALFR